MKHLSYIEDARCLKVNLIVNTFKVRKELAQCRFFPFSVFVLFKIFPSCFLLSPCVYKFVMCLKSICNEFHISCNASGSMSSI